MSEKPLIFWAGLARDRAPIERRMKMLVGIDVGGTTTNAVLVDGDRVDKTAYVPTDHDDLITNMIAERKTDPVALVLIPGPGTNPRDYNLGEAIILDGAMDFRGKEIDRLNEPQIKEAAASIGKSGISRVAVVGKFCQRNPSHEERVSQILARALPNSKIELGHRVSGHLNFPRRAATTMLTLATKERYADFAAAISRALEERGITSPVYILKADGGTLPLEGSLKMPVETTPC